MRTALSFLVVVLAGSSLTACQQMYTRLVADSKAMAERLTPATTAPADSVLIKPAVNGSVESEAVSVPVDTTHSAADKAPPASSRTNPESATRKVMAERTLSSESKPVVEIAPPADNMQSAQSKPLAQNNSGRTVSNNKPTSESQTSPVHADSPLANDRNDAYQRAHSNQVILRNGDVSIDFSKDMPVINSRNGIDLNSQ